MRVWTRLSAVTAAAVVTALVLTACSEGGSSRRHHSSTGGSDSSHDDGGVHKDDPDDTDDRPTGGSSRRPSQPHRPNDRTIAAILPDLAALHGTPYTALDREVSAQNGADADLCQVVSAACESLRAHGDVSFTDSSDEDQVQFELYGYSSGPAALDALEAIETDLVTPSHGFSPSGWEHHGEDGSGFTFGDDEHVAFLVQGPYLGVVNGSSADQALGETLNDMFSERISQSLHGETPSATVSSVA
jgi:hypothetical protein